MVRARYSAGPPEPLDAELLAYAPATFAEPSISSISRGVEIFLVRRWATWASA